MFVLKTICLLCVIILSFENSMAGSLTPRGATKELSGEARKEALDLLDASLAKLSTGDGPNYKVGKVTSVKGQTVGGTLNTFEVNLANGEQVGKECTVKIWTQPWLSENGTNIKIQCAGDVDELNQTW